MIEKAETGSRPDAEQDSSARSAGGPGDRNPATRPDRPQAKPYSPRSHPLRQVLNNELHARPFAALTPPERVSHLALHSGEEGAAEDYACLVRLCKRHAVTPPQPGVNHFSQDFGAFRLRWERHTEFVSYTFFRSGPFEFDAAFREPVIDLVARDWLEDLSDTVLVAAHVALLSRDHPPPTTEELGRVFHPESLSGSLVSGGAAAAFTDFHIHADGFSRVFIHDRHLGTRQAGRLVQRLLELQTYRMMALLALPLAREKAPEIARCERDLAEATTWLVKTDGLAEERALLDRLTLLAASIEGLSAETSYRFRATGAYRALVERRLEDLREQRIPGLQTFAEFMDRRFQPAMRTCQSTAERLDSMSQRVARVSQLLHTRVGISVQEQNRNVLQSVDRRARMQLLLQETVEGLSAVAMAYYSVGLIAYALKALKPLPLEIDPEIAAGTATPVVFVAVWLFLRHLRRKILGGQDADTR